MILLSTDTEVTITDIVQQEAEAAKKAAEEPEVSTASVIAVGDNLYHGSLIESGENDL